MLNSLIRAQQGAYQVPSGDYFSVSWDMPFTLLEQFPDAIEEACAQGPKLLLQDMRNKGFTPVGVPECVSYRLNSSQAMRVSVHCRYDRSRLQPNDDLSPDE